MAFQVVLRWPRVALCSPCWACWYLVGSVGTARHRWAGCLNQAAIGWREPGFVGGRSDGPCNRRQGLVQRCELTRLAKCHPDVGGPVFGTLPESSRAGLQQLVSGRTRRLAKLGADHDR